MRNLIGHSSAILNRTTQRLPGHRHAWVALSSIRTDVAQSVEEIGQQRRPERISVDGSLSLPYPPSVEPGSSSHADPRARPRMPSSSQHPSSNPSAQGTEAGRPPSLAAAAPAAPPITAAQLTQLVEFLTTHRNILVITGAGCSTESNLPDYRWAVGVFQYSNMHGARLILQTPPMCMRLALWSSACPARCANSSLAYCDHVWVMRHTAGAPLAPTPLVSNL
jgi:hypothetical protein